MKIKPTKLSRGAWDFHAPAMFLGHHMTPLPTPSYFLPPLSPPSVIAEDDTRKFQIISDTQKKYQVYKRCDESTLIILCNSINLFQEYVFEKQQFICLPRHSVVCVLFASLLRWIH